MEENKYLHSDCYVSYLIKENIKNPNKKLPLSLGYKLINKALQKGTELLPTYN